MTQRSVSALVALILFHAVSLHAAPLLSLPQSGQTTCFDSTGTRISCGGTHQDGETRTGASWPAERFVTSGGTVTDNLTDLVWLRSADCFGPLGWQEALDRARTLASGACGLDDGSVAGQWRLPNRKELLSLASFDQADGGAWLARNGFVNPVNYWYWSSDSFAGNPGVKWVFHPAGALWTDDQSGINPRTFHALFVRNGTDAAITVAPASVDFGAVDAGVSSGLRTVTISNTGSAPLAVASTTLTGTDATQFVLDAGSAGGACGSLTPVIAPGTGCTVSLRFAPATRGEKTASLHMVSNAVNATVRDIPLTGTATEGASYHVTPAATGPGAIVPSTVQGVLPNGTASFTLQPASGSHLASVAGCGGTLTGSTFVTGPITANCSVEATFEQNGMTEIVKAFRHVAGETQLTEMEKTAFDLAPLGADGRPRPNGVVDVADVVIMLRRLVGLNSW